MAPLNVLAPSEYLICSTFMPHPCLYGLKFPSLRCLIATSPLRDDLTNGAGIVRGKEKPSVRRRNDGTGPAIWRRDFVFADDGAVRRHSANLVGKILGEPEIAAGRDRDAA